MNDPRATGLFGLVVGLALLAPFVPAAHAKAWSKWAPAPLASDSSYRALSARPMDSLTVGQYVWLGVQRDWRAQRDAEARSTDRVISEVEARLHRPRRGDGRFAELASRPYEALADSERAWLAVENEAQRADRAATGSSGAAGLAVFVGVLAVVVAFGWGAAYGVTHLFP